jgi:hypothetical protein
LEADASLFRASAQAGIKKSLAGVRADIPLGVDSRRANMLVKELKARIDSVSDKLVTIKVTDAKGEAVVGRLQKRLSDLAKKLATVTLQADPAKLNATIAKEEAHLAKLQEQASSIKLDADDAAFLSKIADLNAEYYHLDKRIQKGIKIKVDADAADARLLAILAEIEHLEGDPHNLTLMMNADSVDKAIVASERRIAELKSEAANLHLGFRTQDIGGMNADLLGIQAAMHGLGGSVDKVSDRLTRGRVSWFGWIGGLLSAKVALFAGAREVGGLHLALDSLVEVFAILVPALAVLSLGLGAFAAAAFLGQHTLERIVHHMQNLQVVADATGQKIPPLTDHFDKLARVIRPQVFELMGQALGGAGKAMGVLDGLAVGTGKILDRFAAQIVVDMQGGGQGIKTFVKTGTEDLKLLGGIFVNIGHVIAQLGRIAAQTGIAEHLLKGLAFASKALSLFLDLPVPLLALVAGLHGIYLWSGLATTALVKMALGPVRGIAAMVGGIDLATGAVRNLDKESGGLKRIKAYGKDIGTGFAAVPGRVKALGKALLGLAANPWTWAVVGVTALIGVSIWLATTKTRAQQMAAALDKLVSHASIFNVINTTAAAAATASKDLTKAQRDLTKATTDSGTAANGAASRYKQFDWSGKSRDVITFTDSHNKLTGQLVLETKRLTQVSDKFGTKGLAGAMALAALAGVDVNKQLLGNSKDWAIAVQQIQGLVDGYAAMGQGSGQLASDLNALTVAGSEQIKAMGQLNDAYDTFIKITSGPTTGFITFAEGLVRFSEDSKKAGARMEGFGGAIENTSKKVRSSSLQLRSDFQDTINNAEQMADAMRLTGTSAGTQIRAIKLVTQVLIPMAGSNKAAAAEIHALAQEAGGPAQGSLKDLAKWAGKTNDPLTALDKVAQDTSVSFSNLSVDAQKLGTALSQDLSKDMAIAVENAVGLQGAMNTFAHDIRDAGTSIGQTETDRKKLIDDLAALGIKGPAADSIIKAIVGRLGNAKGPVNAAAAAFEKFATDGLDLSTAKADKLWKELNKSPLLKAAGDATTARDKWISLAMDGFDLSRAKADKLWKMLRMQYLTKLSTLVDTSKDKWIKLAMDGLDLNRTAAEKLWKKYGEQRLDEIGRKTDTTRGKFERLAKQIGINKDKADLWFDALHRLPAHTNLEIKVTAAGFVNVNGVQISAGAYFSPHAEGGFISGGTPNRDSVPGMLMPGEVVVPTKMVNQGAVDHLRGQLPGFSRGGRVRGYAAGGLVGDAGDLRLDFPQRSQKAINSFAIDSTIRTAVAATKAFAAFVKMQMANMGGSGSDIVGFARSFLGKIPYRFGGTTMQGMDCSGFTSMVYKHAGYKNIPRTSEAQGSWVTATHTPQAGGLAFYHSPAGGPDPGHVAVIDRGANTAISQGGGLGPKIIRLHALPLLWTGVPPGGFKGPSGGKSGTAPAQAQAWMKAHLGDYGWGQNQWNSLRALWNGESGWRWNANNPSSGAYGIPQSLPGNKMATVGADWRTNPVTQMRWGAEYIRGVYGNPNTAYSKWLARSPHWYGMGGEVPSYAAGGTVGGLRSRLATEQKGERDKYFGLTHAYAIGPASQRTATIKGELVTLSKRQAAELGAYASLSGAGMTTTHLHHLGAAARSELSTASDKGLNKYHRGFAADLRKYLAQISVTASGTVPANSPSGGPPGTPKPKPGQKPLSLSAEQTARQGQTYLNAWRSRHGGGYGAAWGPVVVNQQIADMQAAIGRANALAKAPGLSAGKHRFWANAALDEKRRLGVLNRELGIERNWRGQLGATNKTLASDIKAAGSLGSLRKSVVSWKAQMAAHNYTIGQISKMLGYSKAQIAKLNQQGKIGPDGKPLPKITHVFGGDVGERIGAFLAGAASPFRKGGMVKSFDRGGWLSPGLTMAYNGTGRSERVSNGGDTTITLMVDTSSGAAMDQMLAALIKKYVKVHGGNVQTAYGAH